MSDYFKYRILEIIPGFLVWTTLILSVILSFVKPLWLIYFIIVFDLYWFLRVSYFIFYLFLSGFRMRRTLKIDWQKKLEEESSGWQKLVHLVFLPTYEESFEIIDATLKNLTQVNYPLNKIIIVLCGEAR